MHIVRFATPFTILTIATTTFNLITTAAGQTPPASTCQTPPIQCCTTLTPANNPTVAMVLKGLGITPVHPEELAGLTCSAINGTLGPGGDATWYVQSVISFLVIVSSELTVMLCSATNFQPVCCGQICKFFSD